VLLAGSNHGALKLAETFLCRVLISRFDQRSALADDRVKAHRFPGRHLASSLVTPEIKQAHQDPPALIDLAREELVERSLGKQHGLRECLEVEPDELL
jgi:hypothetical protein